MVDVEQPAAQGQGEKKIKMTYEEYQQFALRIIKIMKDFEYQGEDNVRQGDIIELLIK